MFVEKPNGGNNATNTTYIIGDDVLAQASSVNIGLPWADHYDPQYLLYDGHGSTRQLMASDGTTVDDSYSCDAYGVMLGGNPASAPTTSLLYAGEQFDIDAQMYYNRARYYDQNTGRLNRVSFSEQKAVVFTIINFGGNWYC